MSSRSENSAGFCGKWVKRTISTLIIIFVILFAPGLPPPDSEFPLYTLSPKALKGPLSINTKLNNAELLFKHEVKGPEDFDIYKNELYTSCHLGVIYKLDNGKLKTVLKTGKDCDGLYEEHICGRPLGIKFDKDGTLYITDAYFGLLKANVTTGTYETLVSSDEKINGKKPMLPNNLVIDNGIIYWTDSSTIHNVRDGLYTWFGQPSGRVLKYIISEKRSEVLIENLHFSNGVMLSNDGNFLIIAETFRARLIKYHLKGPQKGTSEVFIDDLPGFPDNINQFGKNHYVVSLVLPVDTMAAYLASTPYLRKFICRITAIIQTIFKTLNYFYQTKAVDKIIHWLGHFEMLQALRPLLDSSTISVIFDNNGSIIGSLHSTDKRISSISSIIEFNNYYYLGSPFNPYLARVSK